MRVDDGSTAVAEPETTDAIGDVSTPNSEEFERLRKRQGRELEVVHKVGKIILEITEQEAVIEEAKGKLKNLIGQRDRLNHELHEIILGQGDTLFDGVVPQAQAPGDVTPTPDDDESWRAVDLRTLDIDEKTLEKLAAKDIVTLGNIADFTAAIQNKLTDIEGIGPATAEKIESALDKYWAKNPRVKKEEPKDEAGVTNDARSIVVPFDIGLNVDEVVEARCEDILEMLADNAEPKIDALKATVAGAERLYLNVGNFDPESGEVNADGDKPAHRLIPLLTSDEFKTSIGDDFDSETDKLVGQAVKVGRKSYVIGRRTESIFVSISE